MKGAGVATIREGNRTILLVVDVQVAVVRQSWDAARVVGNVALAVGRARAHGVPVLWVQHEDDDMPHDSPQWQWVPELAPAAGEPRIFKRYNSSFEETPLEQALAKLGATHIVLAGAMTNWCIRATAYAALERGYDLTLLSDAHTTAAVDRGNGTAIPAADIVDELNVAMTWLTYPGRRPRTAKAAELEF
jgi:nicotinamidase-related amidase